MRPKENKHQRHCTPGERPIMSLNNSFVGRRDFPNPHDFDIEAESSRSASGIPVAISVLMTLA